MLQPFALLTETLPETVSLSSGALFLLLEGHGRGMPSGKLAAGQSSDLRQQ